MAKFLVVVIMIQSLETINKKIISDIKNGSSISSRLLVSVSQWQKKITFYQLVTSKLVREEAKAKMNFDEIYEEYFDKVFNKVYYMVKNEKDAEDIVQEAFISVYKNLSKFEKRSSSYTWVYKIALNKTYDFYRKRKEHFELDEKIIYIDNDNSDTNILLSEYLQKINAFDRKIVILHDIYGYKFREIAKLLDKKLSSIKAFYYKSIKIMGGELNG